MQAWTRGEIQHPKQGRGMDWHLKEGMDIIRAPWGGLWKSFLPPQGLPILLGYLWHRERQCAAGHLFLTGILVQNLLLRGPVRAMATNLHIINNSVKQQSRNKLDFS